VELKYNHDHEYDAWVFVEDPLVLEIHDISAHSNSVEIALSSDQKVELA
jgi:hypothetical protein